MENKLVITIDDYKKLKTEEMAFSYMGGALLDDTFDKTLLDIFVHLGTNLFVDIGCNRGSWIKFIKENFKDVEILGFEPDKRNYEGYLKEYENIHNIGILNKNGYAKFNYNIDSTQTSNHYFNGRNYMYARVKKLDRYYNYIKKYKFPFIKIDVEGSEPEVIYSAKKIIKNLSNLVLYFEYSFKWCYSEKELYKLFQFLSSSGFTLFRLNAFGLELIPLMFYDYLKQYHFSNILALKGFKFKQEDMMKIDTKFGKMNMYKLVDSIQILFKEKE